VEKLKGKPGFLLGVLLEFDDRKNNRPYHKSSAITTPTIALLDRVKLAEPLVESPDEELFDGLLVIAPSTDGGNGVALVVGAKTDGVIEVTGAAATLGLLLGVAPGPAREFGADVTMEGELELGFSAGFKVGALDGELVGRLLAPGE